MYMYVHVYVLECSFVCLYFPSNPLDTLGTVDKTMFVAINVHEFRDYNSANGLRTDRQTESDAYERISRCL